MASLGSLVTNVIANVAPFQKGMRQAQTSMKMTQKAMGALRSAAGALGVTFGAAGLVAAFKDATRAASDFQEIQSKFSVVFGEATPKMEAFADALAKTTMLSRTETFKFLSEAQDLFVPLGFAADEAESLSKQVTQLALDLSSFNNMSLTEAFDRLSSTLVGNHENARAFRVVLNETILKEELAAIGADKLTGSQLTMAKVQARLNILLRGTQAAHGDAERTADSHANKVRTLSGDIEDLKVRFGKGLLPVFGEAMDVLGRSVSGWHLLADAKEAHIKVTERLTAAEKGIFRAINKTQAANEAGAAASRAALLGGGIGRIESARAAGRIGNRNVLSYVDVQSAMMDMGLYKQAVDEGITTFEELQLFLADRLSKAKAGLQEARKRLEELKDTEDKPLPKPDAQEKADDEEEDVNEKRLKQLRARERQINEIQSLERSIAEREKKLRGTAPTLQAEAESRFQQQLAATGISSNYGREQRDLNAEQVRVMNAQLAIEREQLAILKRQQAEAEGW